MLKYSFVNESKLIGGLAGAGAGLAGLAGYGIYKKIKDNITAYRAKQIATAGLAKDKSIIANKIQAMIQANDYEIDNIDTKIKNYQVKYQLPSIGDDTRLELQNKIESLIDKRSKLASEIVDLSEKLKNNQFGELTKAISRKYGDEIKKKTASNLKRLRRKKLLKLAAVGLPALIGTGIGAGHFYNKFRK